MAVRLYSEFKSDRGDQYKIEIHDTQWLAVSTAFNVDGSGFQLTYEGETDDIVSPIVGSKLSFGGYSTDATFETFVNTLKSFQENRFRVVVYRAAASDVVEAFETRVETDGGTLESKSCLTAAVAELGVESYQLFWVGWIVQDLVTIEDESQPYVYQFTATDGIGRLANIDYNFNNDDPAGLTRVTGILDNCLSLIGTDDLWPAGGTYVRTSVDWWETSSQTYATNKDTLYEHGIDVRVFTTEDDDGNTIYSKAFDVLQQLAITYGARVYQTNGRWVFEQYVNRANASRYVTNYDKTMTAIATIAVNDDVTIDQTSGYARLNGGQFNYLPAVGSVSVEYVQEKFSSTSKPFTFRSTAPTKTLGIIGASTSTQLKFYGPHNYNITSSTGATTNDGTIAVVWRLQIRIESTTTPGLYYYYNRAFNGFAASAVYGNAAWSTTAGYYYYHAPFGKVIFGALSLNTAPVVITANLPTSGTLRITSEHYGNFDPINGSAYTLEPHQNDTWSTTLTIARMDNAKDDSSSIIYRVENNNPNVDSNIELNLGTTRIANGLFQTGDLSVYNGTSWVSGLAFRRGSTGSGDQILNLLISEMLGLHAAPIQRFNGEMFNDAMVENRLAFDGARYLNLGGTFTARNGHFSADWFLIDYDAASVGTLDVERQPVLELTSGGSNVGNYDGVIEVGRVAGMAVDATQEKIGPYEQTATGARINGTANITGVATMERTTIIGLESFVDTFETRVTTDGGVVESKTCVSDAITALSGDSLVSLIPTDISAPLTAAEPVVVKKTLDVDGATTMGSTLDVVGRTATSYVQLDTAFVPNGEPAGAFYWDPDGGVAALRGIDGISLDLNEKEVWYVKNQTGAAIGAGTAVYASGTLGSSGQLLIGKMVADGTINAKYFLGITQANIDNGGDGYVVRVGKIRQIDTSTFADGDVLYVSPSTAGALTTTEPTAPNLKLPAAFVIKAAGNGTIAVRQTAGSYLAESHDVQIDSPAENELLARTSSGRWENVELGAILTTTTEKPEAETSESFTAAFGTNSGTIMGEPAKWLPITIGGVNYLMPLYAAP